MHSGVSPVSPGASLQKDAFMPNRIVALVMILVSGVVGGTVTFLVFSFIARSRLREVVSRTTDPQVYIEARSLDHTWRYTPGYVRKVWEFLRWCR